MTSYDFENEPASAGDGADVPSEFSFGGAFGHAFNVDSRGRFWLPYILAYAAAMVGAAVLAALLGGMPGIVLGGVLNALFTILLSAAVYRHQLAGAPFSLGLGRDEWMVFLGTLLFIVFFGALFAAAGLGLALIDGSVMAAFEEALETGGEVSTDLSPAAGLAAFGFFILLLAVFVRFAAVLPVSVLHGEVRFFRSLSATRGRFWRLLGVYVAIFLLLALLSIPLAFLLIAVAGALGAPAEPGLADHAAAFVVVGLLNAAATAVMTAWFSGPGALAALDDPAWHEHDSGPGQESDPGIPRASGPAAGPPVS